MSPRSTLWLAGYVACINLASWLAPGFAEGFEYPLGRSQHRRTMALKGELLSITPSDAPSFSTFLIASGNTVSSPTTVLKLGDRGSQVRALQTVLQQLGYDINPDGVFGQQTQQAIIDFQQETGLMANGQVDAQTWESLQAAQTDISSLLPPSPSPSPEEIPDEPDSLPETEPIPPERELSERELFPAIGWIGGAVAIAFLGGVVGYRLRQSRSIKKPPHRHTSQPATFEHLETVSLDAVPTEAIPVPDDLSTPALDNYHSTQQPGSVEGSLPSDPRNGKGKSSGSASTPPSTEPELARLPKIDITDELIRDLQNPDPIRRRKAVWELGQRGDSKALQPLLDLLVNSDSHQQSLILTAISEIGMRALKPMNRALLHSLQHESADVRKNAIRDVTRIYDQMAQLSQLLHHAVDDADGEVRETAHWALGQLNRVRGAQEREGLPAMPTLEDTSLPQIKADEHS